MIELIATMEDLLDHMSPVKYPVGRDSAMRYAQLCAEVSEKLQECAGLLQRGAFAEAKKLNVSSVPTIIERARILDFARREEWLKLCRIKDWAKAPSLDMETVHALESLQKELEVVSEKKETGQECDVVQDGHSRENLPLANQVSAVDSDSRSTVPSDRKSSSNSDFVEEARRALEEMLAKNLPSPSIALVNSQKKTQPNGGSIGIEKKETVFSGKNSGSASFKDEGEVKKFSSRPTAKLNKAPNSSKARENCPEGDLNMHHVSQARVSPPCKTSMPEHAIQAEKSAKPAFTLILLIVTFALFLIAVAVGIAMLKKDNLNENQERGDVVKSTELPTAIESNDDFEETQNQEGKKARLRDGVFMSEETPNTSSAGLKNTIVKLEEKTFQPTPKQQYDLLIALLKAYNDKRCVVGLVGKDIPEIAKTEPDKLFVAEDGSVSTKEVTFHFKDGFPSYTLKIKDIDFGKKEFLGCIPKYKKPQPEDVTLLEKYHFITVVKYKIPDVNSHLRGYYNALCDRVIKSERDFEATKVFPGYSKLLKDFEEKLKTLKEAVPDTSNTESSALDMENVSAEDLNQELEKLEGKMKKLPTEIGGDARIKKMIADKLLVAAKKTVSKLIKKDSKDRSEKDLNEAKQKVNAARDAVKAALEASNMPFEDEDISTNANSPVRKQAQKPSGNNMKKRGEYDRFWKLRDETIQLYIQLCKKSTEQMEYSLEEISLHEKWKRIQSALDRLTNAECDKYLKEEQRGGSNQELERTAKDELGKIDEEAKKAHAKKKETYDNLQRYKKALEDAKHSLDQELQDEISDQELLAIFRRRMKKNGKIKYGDPSWPELQEWLENHVTYEKYQRR